MVRAALPHPFIRQCKYVYKKAADAKEYVLSSESRIPLLDSVTLFIRRLQMLRSKVNPAYRLARCNEHRLFISTNAAASI